MMAIEGLREFNLAGGTALALQIGHRTSYDLVFFEDADHDAPVLLLNQEITWEEVKDTIRHHVSKL